MIAWLNGLKLSLTSWLLVTAAALIGLLCALLGLQGRRLHKAQVGLLQEHTLRVVGQDDEKVAKAASVFQEALDAYLKAGGKL